MAVNAIGNLNISADLTKQIQKTDMTADSFSSFKDLLSDAIENVNQSDEALKADMQKIATGQTDDLHTIMINTAKADLALQTLVQIRNKALDAYNEIMRINL